MKKNKQKNTECEPDFNITPYQTLLMETSQHNYNPKKVKKAFIKVFGTENIRIAGGMSLDEFIDEWCRVNRLRDESMKELDERQGALAHMLTDILELYTEGQRLVHLRQEDVDVNDLSPAERQVNKLTA